MQCFRLMFDHKEARDICLEGVPLQVSRICLFESHFKGPKLDRLNDPAAWNNLFYEHITSKVDEDIFRVVFDPDIGRPNSGIWCR